MSLGVGLSLEQVFTKAKAHPNPSRNCGVDKEILGALILKLLKKAEKKTNWYLANIFYLHQALLVGRMLALACPT